MNSFTFEMKGALEYVLNDIGESPITNYSLSSAGIAYPYSGDPNSIIMRLIQVFYFLLTLIVPLLLINILLYVWIFPLTIDFQLRMYYWVEILYAWAFIDVASIALISMMGAQKEFRSYSQYLINKSNQCEFINYLLRRFFQPDLNGDDCCLDLTAYIYNGDNGLGWWLLISGLILFTISVNCIRVMMWYTLKKAIKKSS